MLIHKFTSYCWDLISLVSARQKYRNVPFSNVSALCMFVAMHVVCIRIRDLEPGIINCVLILTDYVSCVKYAFHVYKSPVC